MGGACSIIVCLASICRAENRAGHRGLRKNLRQERKLLQEIVRQLDLGGHNDRITGEHLQLLEAVPPRTTLMLPADYGSIGADQEKALNIGLTCRSVCGFQV